MNKNTSPNDYHRITMSEGKRMHIFFIILAWAYSANVHAAYWWWRTYNETLEINGKEGTSQELSRSLGSNGASTSSFNTNHITVCAETLDEMVNLRNPKNFVWGGAYTATTARQLGSNTVSARNSGTWVVPAGFNVNNKIYCALKRDNNRSIAQHNKGQYDLVTYSFVVKSNVKLTINAPSTVKLKDVSPNETATSQFTIRSLISGGGINELFQGKLSWSLRKNQSNPTDTSLTINYNGIVGNTGNVPVSIYNNKDYGFEISHRAIKPGEYKFFMDVVLSID